MSTNKGLKNVQNVQKEFFFYLGSNKFLLKTTLLSALKKYVKIQVCNVSIFEILLTFSD